jgi:phosphohistidine swiveling domain-containing protein
MNPGGKALPLIALQKHGFNVPHFFVCDSTWSEDDLLTAIKKELPLTTYFAARSSAYNEDSSMQSFAGHFYSALGIIKEQVFSEVQNVIKSFDGAPGSVIVQAFIPSDSSGVMFTKTSNASLILINATFGLCTSVVEGLPCDEYTLDTQGIIIDKTITAEKPVTTFQKGEFITHSSSPPSLTKKELEELATLAASLNTFFKTPQDVEWCFLNGELYVLQSRPITRELPVTMKEHFDSANIAESYSGIVLPLTYSFAQMVYEQVYKDLLIMSGASKAKVKRHEEIFKGLLGHYYGRMYYNMSNWYQMTSFIPGYNRNKGNLELMITSNIREDISRKVSPSIWLRIFYPTIVIIKVLFFDLNTRHFTKKTEASITTFMRYDYSTLSYEDSLVLFKKLHSTFLKKWYITVENDFFVMTYLGILTRFYSESDLQKIITFDSKATEQVSALVALSHEIKKEEDLWSDVLSLNDTSFFERIKGYPNIKKILDNYIVTFGGRFASELKLESLGIDEDPKRLLSMIAIYSTFTRTSFSQLQVKELKGVKKIVAKLLLSKFKKYASKREEFRLLRSNTFAITRKLFRRMGAVLTEDGKFESVDDVFYCTVEELLDAESLSSSYLKELVATRKEEYESYKKISPPTHFSVTAGKMPSLENPTQEWGTSLQGRAASPGKLRGKVRVFKDFYMPSDIDFDILVTSHTDPGWTTLIALSKGLIIEHGGVLSHASIVARELGIPAVIGASHAVEVLKNGQTVEIDGSTGTITIL